MTMFTTQMIIYVIVIKSCVEKHQLKFTKDRSGQEIFNYYRVGESRPARTESYNFDWEWIDQEMEGLKLDRGAGEIHYFDNVWVRQNYLSGKLDGIEVTFVKE